MSKALNKYQQGVGLIEVLIALVVLSTALLALALLQARSLQFNHSSYLESQSNVYAYDILERIRVSTLNNPALLDSYNATVNSTSVATVSNATAKTDIESWRLNSIKNLPGGSATITCVTATRRCNINISWSDLSGVVDKDGVTPKITFPYTAML